MTHCFPLTLMRLQIDLDMCLHPILFFYLLQNHYFLKIISFFYSTYKWYYVCLSFSSLFYLAWYLSSLPLLWQMLTFNSFFYGRVVFHCICMPHLIYPLICWWIFRLLLYLGNNAAMKLKYRYLFKSMF